MPIIEVEGRKVEVDPSFMSLPPAQQNALVMDIAARAKLTPSGAPARQLASPAVPQQTGPSASPNTTQNGVSWSIE